MKNYLKALGLLTNLLRAVDAFSSIDVPATINANQSTPITILNDLHTGPSSFDAQYTTYRIYLSITAPSTNSTPHPQQPSCYLANATHITTGTPNITIPPSVGPDGTAYRLATMEYSTAAHGAAASGFEYSAPFNLLNTTAAWSEADVAGAYPLFPDLLPCEAYDCARACLADGYPGNVNGSSAAGLEAAYRCMAGCEGVAYPTWEEVRGQGAAEGGPLAGAGGEPGEVVVLQGYQGLLSSVSLAPTRTAVRSTGTATTTVASATATETGGGDVVRARGVVVIGVVAVMQLVDAVL